MNIYAPHVFSTPASHKRAMDPVELSYKAAVWLLATETHIRYKGSKCS